MNFLYLLKELEQVDPEIVDRLSPRRAAIKNITSFGSKVTIAALPFAIVTLFKKAYGATTLPADVAAVFNLGLTLEYLEAGFYTQGISTPNFIPAADLPSIRQILTDENHHIAFLQNLLGAQALPAPAFDYTGGGGTGHGPFTDAFTLYASFLKVAVALEDTGVRAYQGGFPTLLGQQTLLTAAFNIHSVESRHSSHVHQLFYKLGEPIKPWIIADGSNETGLNNPELSPVYADEENTVQLGVITNNDIAFDEPMQPANVKTFLNNIFIASPKLV